MDYFKGEKIIPTSLKAKHRLEPVSLEVLSTQLPIAAPNSSTASPEKKPYDAIKVSDLGVISTRNKARAKPQMLSSCGV